MILRQEAHLFLNFQGTKMCLEKACTTRREFVSTHNHNHCFSLANSMACITAQNSTWREHFKVRFFRKIQIKLPLQSLKISLEPGAVGELVKILLQLHMIQLRVCVFQTTSLIVGARVGWIVMLNALIREKFWIDEVVVKTKLLLVNMTWAIMFEIMAWKGINLLMKRAMFLSDQMELIEKIQASLRTKAF